MCVWLWCLAHRRLKCSFEASTIYDLNSATREVGRWLISALMAPNLRSNPAPGHCPNFRSTPSFNLWLPSFRCPIFPWFSNACREVPRDCLQHPVSLAGLSFEERLCTQVRKDRMACPAATWQKSRWNWRYLKLEGIEFIVEKGWGYPKPS